MKFRVEKKIDLSFVGDKWNGCYLIFNALTYKDVKMMSGVDKKNIDNRNTEKVFALLKSNFIEGKAFDGKEIVDIKVDDLEELPIEIVARIVNEMVGGLEKKD